MKNNRSRWYALLLVVLSIMTPSVAQNTKYVNLFIGTSGDNGQVAPGAAAPFGMVCVCPDNDPRSHAGYDYAVTKVSGISVNRLSGVGCSGGGGNLRIRPVAPSQELHIKKSREKATPGYYSTAFTNGIKTELTATNAMAVERYKFPRSLSAALWIDFASTFEDVATCHYKRISETCIEGYVQAKNVCGHGRYKLYFSLNTSHPFQLEEQKEMNEEISDFRKFETKLHQMKKEIQKQNQNLEQLNQHISVNEQSIKFMDKKMEEYKEAEMNYTLLKDLSDTANGEQKGKAKISFERFVQSVYFDLILAAANERLSVMSEQRYYLLRKEENDINKGSSGLELEILDEWTGKRRNVRSLSGGESFKAALSLALGLSDVIQNKKGGIQVDTIFIDEGFGTLDADSLNKAMQIINSLSLEGNKLVGIISHVDELKDQIDQKIEVYKDHAGSKVK